MKNRISFFAIFATLLFTGCAGKWIGAGFPQPGDATFETRGLTESVRIDYDRYFVPHITASDDKDAFYALGYAMASARLHQMDILRHVAQGRLSEVYGPTKTVRTGEKKTIVDVLEVDYFLRILDFSDSGKRLLHNASDKNRAVLKAFATGVNAFVEVNRQSKSLSAPYSMPERLGGRTFEPWTAANTAELMMLNAWSSAQNFADEIFAVRALQAGTPVERIVDLLSPHYPLRSDFFVYLDEMRNDLRGVRFIHGMEMFDTLSRAEIHLLPFTGASMAFSVSGKRSAGGKPILAANTHSAASAPGFWFVAHLSSRRFNVAGAFPVGVPFCRVGHNGSVAWAISSSRADVVDLAIESINADKKEYRLGDKWESMPSRSVRLGAGKMLMQRDMYGGAFGPIITEIAPGSKSAVSLRWTGWEPGGDIDAGFALMRSQSAAALKETAQGLNLCYANLVYADVGGGYGWIMTGDIPVRKGFAGLMPKNAADPKQDWFALLPFDSRPEGDGGDEGFIATANNRPNHAKADVITMSWSAPFRHDRLRELLGANDALTLDDSRQIQMDVFNRQADAVLPYVTGIAGAGSDLRQTMDVLNDWDRRVASDSHGALYYEVFLTHFVLESVADLPPYARRAYLARPPFSQVPFDGIARRETALWKDGRQRDILIKKALSTTGSELAMRFGGLLGTATWGDLHRVYFKHPLSEAALIGKEYRITPLPFGGDGATIHSGAFRYGQTYDTQSHPSLRFMIDMAEPESARIAVAGGQSEIPGHESYINFLNSWYRGEDHKLLYSDSQLMEASIISVVTLTPRR